MSPNESGNKLIWRIDFCGITGAFFWSGDPRTEIYPDLANTPYSSDEPTSGKSLLDWQAFFLLLLLL
jgi:hypothetical protein